jgi:hypothetical protein
MSTFALLPSSWDPYGALGLNPNDRTTCIGHAKTKRRECHSRVSKDSRDKACEILNHLSTQAQSLDDLIPQLRDLAKLLLCKTYHQNQADEIVNRWQFNLTFELFTPSSSPILEVPRTRAGTGPAPNCTERNPTQRVKVITPPPDNEPSVADSHRPSRTRGRSQVGANQNINNSAHQSANATARLRQEVRQGRIPSSGRMTETIATENVQATRSLRSRDCKICYSVIEENGRILQCTRCGNGYHLDCWEQWERSQRAIFEERHETFPGVSCPTW